MINYIYRDVAIIGAGAAGLFAGTETASAGLSTLIIDREQYAGGILNQCIHNGFGVHSFKKELTGPEFAAEAEILARKAGAELRLASAVNKITRQDDGTFQLELLSGRYGVSVLECKAVIFATGCRERNRGNLAIPGNRPAGVWSAGTAQKLLNCDGLLPGKKVVIVGSGDIGLIMARRLSWCGAEVPAVIEILPRPSGLVRNIAQCLEDFNIPLLLSHTVTKIAGKDHVEFLECAPLADGKPDLNKVLRFECDAVLFSVGLVPSVELLESIGAELDPVTGGAVTDSNGETSIPGIFCAGNALHVHDLVDFVAEEAAETGKAVVRKLNGTASLPQIPCRAGKNLRYVSPHKFACGEEIHFRFRPVICADKALLSANDGNGIIQSWKLNFVNPAEMIQIAFTPENCSELLFELEEI